jgi:dTDP-4-dehydrorhamnose reductase
MVRVLVTGAGGGLGRAWVERLGREGTSLAPAWPGEVEVVACTREQLDVASPHAAALIEEEIRPDLVLNCAGRVDLEYCEASPWEAFRVNRDGADHVARACAKRGALPVYFSTDLVFDGGKLQPYREEDPPNPLNAYGESKLAGELRTASVSRRHLIVRSGWIYGQPGRHFLMGLEGSIPFQVIDTQTGQATWVEDFLEAVLVLLRAGRTGRWHVASPGAVTQSDVARRARELRGGRGAPAIGRGSTMIAPLPAFTVLDVAKLESAGHVMRPGEEGLEAYIKTL